MCQGVARASPRPRAGFGANYRRSRVLSLVRVALSSGDKEMAAQGRYFVEDILQGGYKQGFWFLVKWRGYSAADSTWKTVKAFLLDGSHVRGLVANFNHDHQPRYNTTLKECWQLSKKMAQQK